VDRDRKKTGGTGKNRIGVERESSLHRALKIRYAGSEDRLETMAAGYVCDGVTETGEFIEVQTGSFGPLKGKAEKLAELGPVRIIHPIILRRDIEVIDPGGILIRRRKSPRRGTIWDLFKALLYAPELPLIPNIRIELALVAIRERRSNDGRGSWRRKGASILDRELTDYLGSVPLCSLQDYRQFIPPSAGDTFSVKTFGEEAEIQRVLARKTLYVLTKLGITERIGKEGNAWIYRRS
jgi:hypothetical protein